MHMSSEVLIQRIQLPAPGLDQMQAEARKDAYRFLETLLDEWVGGKNRFDGPGEVLCGHFDSGLLIMNEALAMPPERTNGADFIRRPKAYLQ